jgi:hypothetical protein
MKEAGRTSIETKSPNWECSRSVLVVLLKVSIINMLLCSKVSAFPSTADFTTRRSAFGGRRTLWLQATEDGAQGESSLDSGDLYLERFKRRRKEVETKVKQEEARRPPNPNLSPTQFVTEILNGLRDPNRPAPLFGFKILLRSSTLEWQHLLCRSVGAPPDVNEDVVSAALESAFSRANNQFRILVEPECKNENYLITFPTDPIDYEDGTCWVECRLRGKQDDALLVALGWSLVRRNSDAAWIVDAIDWQDFRDSYRPGIGREEWERICG